MWSQAPHTTPCCDTACGHRFNRSVQLGFVSIQDDFLLFGALGSEAFTDTATVYDYKWDKHMSTTHRSSSRSKLLTEQTKQTRLL